MRYVIVGRSIAGLSALKEIRGNDMKGEITVISAEKTRAYYRPMVASLIEKEMDITIPDDPVERYAANVLFGTVAGLDTSSREIILASNKRKRYDKLLIATGSSPIVPDIQGLDGSDAFPLRTMEHALGIRTSARGKKNAVVIGGGFVGTKASIALRNIGLHVVVVEQEDHLLPGRLDRRGALIVADVMRKRGIEIMTNDTVSEVIRSSGFVKSVKLSSGGSLDADMIVIAAGALPNVDAFRKSGIRISRGIEIDESLLTSAPDVYAAGDVAEYIDLVTGAPSVSALWSNAEEMGKLAGRNMAGGTIRYRGFLSVMNATEVFGVPVMSIGLITPEGSEFETVVEDTLETYRKLVFKNDVLVGVVFIGDISNAGIYTNLIKNAIPIGSLKEEAINGNLTYVNFVNTIPQQTLSV